MKKYTKFDILKNAKEENVRYIRLMFTDIQGIIKSVEETSVMLEIDSDVKIRVDKGAIVTNPGSNQQQNK